MTKKQPGNKDHLVFVPLGGSGEIGMNLNLYGYGPPGKERWIIVDVGVTFGGDINSPGIELIMADHKFIADRRDQLEAIVLTHAHEDHVGALAHQWPDLRAPVYATPFTMAIAREKLGEKGLVNEVDLREIPLSGRLKAGPFDIEYISITHSILEPNALAIRTPLGTIMHTGDWKLDPTPVLGEATDVKRFKEVGAAGVLAMVCDSTNAISPGRAGSENDILPNLSAEIAKCRGRAVVTTFASNAARLKTIFTAAQENDRHVVLAGRSMDRILRFARQTGYLGDLPDPVDMKHAGHLPRDKMLILCTGSQGEARAALSRIASNKHSDLTLNEGDTVIFSSKVIPGNEKSIFRIYSLLAAKGVNIVTGQEGVIHVSGHPYQDELKDMYGWIRPEIAIPVHGEMRHMMEHAKLADKLQVPISVVPHNGIMIELAPKKGAVIGEVHAGRLYMDGTVLTDAATGPADERRRMGFAGIVTVTIVLDHDNKLVGQPVVQSQGVPQFEKKFKKGFDVVMGRAAGKAVSHMSGKDRRSDEKVMEVARLAVRQAARKEWNKKPVAKAAVVRLK